MLVIATSEWMLHRLQAEEGGVNVGWPQPPQEGLGNKGITPTNLHPEAHTTDHPPEGRGHSRNAHPASSPCTLHIPLPTSGLLTFIAAPHPLCTSLPLSVHITAEFPKCPVTLCNLATNSHVSPGSMEQPNQVFAHITWNVYFNPGFSRELLSLH